MTDNAVRLTYPQYRAVRRLVHDCCNYDGGNCLLLDDGEECVCPQSISYSQKAVPAVIVAAVMHCAVAGTSQNPTGPNTARSAPRRKNAARPVSGCAATGPPCNGLGP